MNAAEFDKFADEYLAVHAKNIRISGESPEYFASYKVQEIRRRWSQAGWDEPRTILDFGTGVGASTPHLRAAFPDADILGLDVSARSLAIAESRHGDQARFGRYDGGELPAPERRWDLIFSSCVFHHIDAAEHAGLLSQLRRALGADGRMVIFEHNPINPVTRYIVATCEFDENAVLMHARSFRDRQRRAGFSSVEVTYTGFFPGALRALRPLERHLGWLPIGAQYYTLARP